MLTPITSGLLVFLHFLGLGCIVYCGTRKRFIRFPNTLPVPDDREVHRGSQRPRESRHPKPVDNECGREHQKNRQREREQKKPLHLEARHAHED
ncbi:hypothetical protein [Microbacterium enclense]|uniref:hypothetical protein n=1 Tax=Microbacterium enclense TaxID=993073 RepID=UPI00341F567F